jgi:hypothetical protein
VTSISAEHVANQEADTPGGRFNWFITECYGGVLAFVEKFGFNASQVYRTISNSSSPRLETCVEYSATGINIQWMASGEGPWWAPNDRGRELARMKGIVISEGDQAEGTIDYAVLVRTIFDMGERSVLERLAELHDMGKGSRSARSGSKSTGEAKTKKQSQRRAG